MIDLHLGRPKFELANIVATPGVLVAVHPDEIAAALKRHQRGDWGDLCQEDIEENERSLREGSRLFSSYQSTGGAKFWIITEWDRSVTTVLLPTEY